MRQVTAEGDPDEVVERVSSDEIKLYQVSDESGSMTTEEVTPEGDGLTADLLNVRRRSFCVSVCVCLFVCLLCLSYFVLEYVCVEFVLSLLYWYSSHGLTGAAGTAEWLFILVFVYLEDLAL